jgi:hypothetical protein
MPAQWFACPFLRRDGSRPGQVGRYMMIQDFAAQIAADGGAWDYFECGGGPDTSYTCGVAVAKIRASQTTLDAVIAAPNIRPIPTSLLNLGDTTTATQRTFLRDTLGPALGFTGTEMTAWATSDGRTFASRTFGEILDFLATRWYRPVYEPTGSQVGWEGNTYPGVVACDGRTTTTGVTSEPWTPIPKQPAAVAANVSNT